MNWCNSCFHSRILVSIRSQGGPESLVVSVDDGLP